MNHNIIYVGLDVSKDKIAMAVAPEGRRQPDYIGMMPNQASAILRQMKRLGKPEQLRVCYEAGVTGYELQRLLAKTGIACEVIAPSLTPQSAGRRVKTDRRDALQLAGLYRSGELVPIYIPDEEDEAVRDLFRAREDVKEDQLRARHRITKFLLRHGLQAPAHTRRWGVKYWDWLNQLTFAYPEMQVTLAEYRQTLTEVEQRLHRLEQAIKQRAQKGKLAPLIQALKTFRGISTITAVGLAAEIGSFQRFSSARAFMAYTGLIPSEYSSGGKRRQGHLTRTGNRHVRRLLVEAAWTYRHRPVVKGDLKKRQEDQPAEQLQLSWQAQRRLHHKYMHLISRGKEAGKVVTAVARELAGFVWALAWTVERPKETGKQVDLAL